MKRFKYLALAALVAFGACDEGDDGGVAPSVTGTISGVVTVEGTAASGVTVTLSSGSTATTDGSGSYSFAGVPAGAYTVSISGGPSDATFSSTAKPATISSAGQVVTVNFDGQFIRTSGIFGAVRAAGAALEGVTVSIGGGMSTTTDVDGGYSFAGLRAGSYDVTISGFDAGSYSFPSTTQSVSVAAGESKSVNFSGQLVSTASITGSLFIDHIADNVYSATAENKLGAAGVEITIFDGTIDYADTTTTDANGDFSFTDLPPGFYAVEIDAADEAIPGNVAFGGTSPVVNVDLDAGESEQVFFPFDITVQALEAAVFYGRDGTAPGISPRSGITLNLFAQESHAVAGTPVLASDTTAADGTVTFRFDREDDTSPAGGQDNIVFVSVGAIPAFHALNGETRIEIAYDSKDSLALAPDTFDVLTNQATLKVEGKNGLGNPLDNWKTVWFKDDTLGASQIGTGFTDTLGVNTMMVGPPVTSITSNLPDTFYVRLSVGQPSAAGLGFAAEAIAGDDGEAYATKFLRVEFDGARANTLPFDAGDLEVTYTQQNLLARVHHEADDSTDVPVFTGGDDFLGAATAQVELYTIDDDGDTVSVATAAPTPGTGIVTFPAVDLGDYWMQARATFAGRAVLNDTISDMITLDGLQQADTAADLTGNAGFSTFAMKHTNTTVRGTVQSPDGVTRASGIKVRIQASPDLIQPNVTDTTLTTVGNGTYLLAGLHEGPYMISVSDSTTADGPVWTFIDTLEVASAFTSGSDDNEDARTAERDTEGLGNVQVANFQAHRADTKIAGVIVNDIDDDNTTIDPGEAASAITVELIEDLDADGVVDAAETVSETTTTGAAGEYEFTGLLEGKDWIVRAVSPADILILRSLSSDGVATQTVGPLTTTAALGTGGTLNQNATRQVGNTFPPDQGDELPRWSYSGTSATTDGGGAGAGPNTVGPSSTIRPAHFIPLYRNGIFRMTVEDDAGDPVQGAVVTITLCAAEAVVPTNPVGAGTGCDTPHSALSSYILSATTDATGQAEITGLLEGVWQATVNAAAQGFPTNVGYQGGVIALFSIQGSGDIETVDPYEVN